jgi:hypothetical protein
MEMGGSRGEFARDRQGWAFEGIVKSFAFAVGLHELPPDILQATVLTLLQNFHSAFGLLVSVLQRGTGH